MAQPENAVESLDALMLKPTQRVMDIQEIMKCIPHRYPFLLVDRVDVIQEGKYAVGTKQVTINEPFFQGHFPGKPVMPGVLILESMAQTCAAMTMSLPDFSSKLAFFMGIHEAKFRRPVLPGETIKICIDILRLARAGKGRGEAYVDGKLVAEAEMTFVFTDKQQ